MNTAPPPKGRAARLGRSSHTNVPTKINHTSANGSNGVVSLTTVVAPDGNRVAQELVLDRIVLGGIMANGFDSLDKAGMEIRIEDFAAPQHGAVMLWLRNNKWRAGLLHFGDLQRQLEVAGLADKIGQGSAAVLDLLTLANGVGPDVVVHHAEELIAVSIDRKRRALASDYGAGRIVHEDYLEALEELQKRKVAKPTLSVRQIMLSRLYDPASPVPEPDYRLWIKGVPIMSAGNISTLVSLPKLGKSSVMVAVVAAGCGEGEYLGLRGDNKDRRPIVHLDTEQSKYHHDQKLRTIAKRLGVEQLPDHVVSFRLTGERLGIENVRESVTIAMERTEGKKPYAVLLDGGVDFILDPNDPDASFSMIKDLMAVADEFDCIIVVSIHYNPSQQNGQSKSRGHYGSELERKSEAYLTINKDGESGHRSLFTKFARERELLEGEAVRFAWDERAGMFNVLSDEVSGYSVDNVLTILEREGGAMERTQLKKLLKENVGGDPRTWEPRIKQAHKDLLVTTTGRPAKVTLTKNGRCRLETKIEQEDDGHADDPF
jgi:hypothetical protein